jgi:hypothetical protein
LSVFSTLLGSRLWTWCPEILYLLRSAS